MNWGKYTMFRSRYHRNSIVLKLWEASEKNQICDLVGIIKWVISIRKNSTRGEVRAASFKSLRPLMKLLDLARWEPTCVHCEETWTVKKDCKRFISQKGKSSQMFPTKTEQQRRKTTTRPILWHWRKRQRQGKRLLVYVDKKTFAGCSTLLEKVVKS